MESSIFFFKFLKHFNTRVSSKRSGESPCYGSFRCQHSNRQILTISISRWNFISGMQASFAPPRGHSVILSEGVLATVLSFNKE